MCQLWIVKNPSKILQVRLIILKKTGIKYITSVANTIQSPLDLRPTTFEIACLGGQQGTCSCLMAQRKYMVCFSHTETTTHSTNPEEYQHRSRNGQTLALPAAPSQPCGAPTICAMPSAQMDTSLKIIYPQFPVCTYKPFNSPLRTWLLGHRPLFWR